VDILYCQGFVSREEWRRYCPEYNEASSSNQLNFFHNKIIGKDILQINFKNFYEFDGTIPATKYVTLRSSLDELSQCFLMLIAIQELNLEENELKTNEFKNYKTQWFKQTGWIIVNKKITIEEARRITPCGRISTITIKLNNKKLEIWNVYLPAVYKQRSEFYEKYIIKLEPTADIILGDFNMITNPTLDKYPTNVAILTKDMEINKWLEKFNVIDTSNIFLVYKNKGSKLLPEYRRPITLSNTDGKILSIIYTQRWKKNNANNYQRTPIWIHNQQKNQG
jgi:hypothetical protein